MVFLEGKLYSILDRKQPDICAAFDAWDDLTASSDEHSEESAEKFESDFVNVRLQNISTNAKDVINSFFTNSHSAAPSHYGLAEVRERMSWTRNLWGLDNYRYGFNICRYMINICWAPCGGTGRSTCLFSFLRLEGSYSILIAHYLNKCKKADKRLNWVVREIKWTGRSASDSRMLES